MAHIKLFFPGLSNSTGICQLLYGHSALSSIIWNGQDQNKIDSLHEFNKTRCESYKKMSLRWRRLHQLNRRQMPIIREKVQNLTFIHDLESNDFSTQNQDNSFIHALQLSEDQCKLSDVETVKSQRLSSASRKLSVSSETESIQLMESIILPIQ